MSAPKALSYLVSLAGLAALILGLALWSGRLHELVSLHIALGGAVVLVLWASAVLAFRRHAVRIGVVLGAATWGVLTLALGLAQNRLLVGDLHWLVEVAHLLVGLGAIALVVFMGRAIDHAQRAASGNTVQGIAVPGR